MKQFKNNKEPWRIIVGIASIAYIVFMWVKKDIVSIYTTMPQEQIVPLIATTVAVSTIGNVYPTSKTSLVLFL